jgi:hypothetical protein
MSKSAFVSSRRILALLTFVTGFALPFAAVAGPRVSQSYGKLPLHFEANQGQAHQDVRFLARGPGYSLYLTAGEAVLVLAKPNPERQRDRRSRRERRAAKTPAQLLALRMHFVGAEPGPRVSGIEELPGKANYFIGNDPAQWRTAVPTYAKVYYRNVYPGIDLLYYGNQRQLEYDFVVAPGADPEKIVLGFQGADRLEIDAQGDLVLHIAERAIRQHKPVIYQEVNGFQRQIDGGYVLKGAEQVGFRVAAYDRSRPLIIDPLVLSYSTYLGGNSTDIGVRIAVDSEGNAYIAGETGSSNFPTTAGAFQITYGGTGGPFSTGDAFVTKLNPTGSALVYSTYLGGGLRDNASAIAVDVDGNAYVTGSTESPDFSTTAGAFQTTFHYGTTEAFVTKLDPTGSALVYSTFLGGNNIDQGSAIAVDASGNAYVTGNTDSTDFPTTAGAFQTTNAGAASTGDAFVTKLNPSGSALVYSTYLGSSGDDDWGHGIAVDAAGNAYVTGTAAAADFPTTPGAFQTSGGGGFITKLDSAGSTLVYSTFLNGAGGIGIALDADGNAYVTGTTNSVNFPTTAGAFQPAPGGSNDAFVLKLNPTGSDPVYSTYLGGSGGEVGSAIAVDADGNAYVTGSTNSVNFPTTAGTSQGTIAGDFDGFIAKIVDAADRTAPSTTASANPAPNAAGWNNSSVAVTLNAADNEGGSGVQSITYRINGDAPSTASGATASFTLSLESVNTITFNATDNAGNAEASKTAVVRIDKTPPSGTLSLSPSRLWPANHELVTIAPSLTVSDSGGGQVTVSGPLVRSSEPETGPGDNTAPDWMVSGETLRLRAERAKGGSGRVYTVTYTLTDQAGNTGQASSTVTVPIKR